MPFDAKDYTDFYERIDHFTPMLDPAFKKAILLLKQKHKQAIINALKILPI